MVNEPLVRELLRCEFIDHHEDVLLIGNSGTGKTHFATALGFAACCQGYKVRFFGYTALVTQLLEAYEDRQLQRWLKQYEKQNLLVLDEHGYVPFSKTGFELPFENLTGVCGSGRLTWALPDRLTHRIHIIKANRASYHLGQNRKRLARQKKRAGQD